MEGGAGLFAIETNTGNISLLNDLNREQTDRYQATITATDNGIPVKLSSKAEVSQLLEKGLRNQQFDPLVKVTCGCRVVTERCTLEQVFHSGVHTINPFSPASLSVCKFSK